VIRALLILAQIYPGNLSLGHYQHAEFNDPAARLDRKLADGTVKLHFREGGLGYLPSLLEQLEINADTQVLVFSKTSFQAQRIGPRNARAIYFSDSVAVGFVPGGDGMEIAALDPREGMVFYTLENRAVERPRITRREECMHCHYGPATLGVPGIFVGSVYPNSTGQPSRDAAIITDHRTAFRDRWGGWYVSQSSIGRSNSVAVDPAEPHSLTALPPFRADRYLVPTSDIVALMTFEHQTYATNLLVRLNWLARGGDASAIDAAIREAVACLTFADEAPLPEPIQGTSTFTKTFPQRGPGREFDLKTRLFRSPVSYMIHTSPFESLPEEIQKRIQAELP
jgi:hypothetical protein